MNPETGHHPSRVPDLPTTMNRVLLRSLPLLMAIWACGCLRPGEPPSTPSAGDSTEPPQITGSWRYSATYSVSAGARGTTTCSMSSVQISLSQSGTSVSGTAHGGQSTCDSRGFRSPEMGTTANPIVIRGTVDERSVDLEVDGFVPLRHRGTVSGDLMRGTVTGMGSVAGIGSVRVTGNWSASR